MRKADDDITSAIRDATVSAGRRPHIRPPLATHEIVALVITIAGMLFTIAPLVYWWPAIPGVIPSHFNIYGQPDAYGPKSTLLIYPAVAVGATLMFQVLCRYPWIFNYPVRITAENAERNYLRGRSLLRWVNASVWLFGVIEWQALAAARGAATSLGSAFSAGLLIAVALLVPVGAIAVIVIWVTRWK